MLGVLRRDASALFISSTLRLLFGRRFLMPPDLREAEQSLLLYLLHWSGSVDSAAMSLVVPLMSSILPRKIGLPKKLPSKRETVGPTNAVYILSYLSMGLAMRTRK